MCMLNLWQGNESSLVRSPVWLVTFLVSLSSARLKRPGCRRGCPPRVCFKMGHSGMSPNTVAILTWKIMINTKISKGFETCPTTPHARNRWTSGKLHEITFVCEAGTGEARFFVGRCTGSQSFTGPLGKGPHESPWKPMKAGFWSLGHLKLPRENLRNTIVFLKIFGDHGDHDIYEFRSMTQELWVPGVLATGGHWKWGLLRRKRGWEVIKHPATFSPFAALGGSKWDTTCLGCGLQKWTWILIGVLQPSMICMIHMVQEKMCYDAAWLAQLDFSFLAPETVARV